MSPRECIGCGGFASDYHPCGCGRYEAQRIADDARFELKDRTVSFTSQALIKDDATAEIALRGVIESTREERIEALRLGPQSRQTLAMSIVIRRCAALSKQEAVREWRDAPVSEAHDG